jgi:hypothetical protein
VEIWKKSKRDGNHSPPKNILVQNSKVNEENRYPDPDSNKTKVNYDKEPRNSTRTT